jgi:isocitrate lyase
LAHIAPKEAIHFLSEDCLSIEEGGSLGLVQQLLDGDAVVIKLQQCFHQTVIVGQTQNLMLVPATEAVQRLVSARMTAIARRSELKIFACTEARRAVAVTDDSDLRDHKHLSGLTSRGNGQVYCGGLNAAIERALLYAPHADVICFKSAMPDTTEARKFAAAVRALFPERQLAFGYSPRPDARMWNELDHVAFEVELRIMGYSYYFFTQFGVTMFPHPPSEPAWAMFDDTYRPAPFDLEGPLRWPAALDSRESCHGRPGSYFTK